MNVSPNNPNGQLVGVSNNVNYDVQGDGSAAYTLINKRGQFRFPGMFLVDRATRFASMS